MTAAILVAAAPGLHGCTRADLSSDLADITVVVDGTAAACDDCRIELRKLTEFGSPSDSVLVLGSHPVVERDSRGRHYVTTMLQPGSKILMFNEAGRLVRTVGRIGDGPGEFRMIFSMMVGRGDSLFVLHDSQLSVADTSGVIVRSTKLHFPTHAASPHLVAHHGDGMLLTLKKTSVGPDTSGLPLSLYGADGRFVRSFGPLGFAGELDRAQRQQDGRRQSRMAADGSIWLRDGNNYRFEQVDDNGHLLRVIAVRTPSEFRLPTHMSFEEVLAAHKREVASRGRPSGGRPMLPPVPVRDTVRWGAGQADSMSPISRAALMSDFALLPGFRLAALLSVGSQRIHTAFSVVDRAKSDAEHTRYYPITDLFDTLIDVIDIRSGVLLSRTHFTGALKFARDGTLHRTTYDDHGVPRFESFSLHVVEPGTPR